MPISKSIQSNAGPVALLTSSERYARQQAENQKLLQGNIGICYVCRIPKAVAYHENLLRDVTSKGRIKKGHHTHMVEYTSDGLDLCKVGHCDTPLRFYRMISGPFINKTVPLSHGQVHECHLVT